MKHWRERRVEEEIKGYLSRGEGRGGEGRTEVVGQP